MKKLFIVDGAMRPAKNELVRCLIDLEKVLSGGTESSCILARKYSTKNDEADQDYTHREDLENEILKDKKMWISYSYENNLYGIRKSELDNYIINHENTFLIVRNTKLISELKQKYSKDDQLLVKVITIYLYSDKKTIESYYSNVNNTSEITLEQRKSRLEKADADYENAAASDMEYDETIIYSKENGTGTSSLSTKIHALIKKYNSLYEPYSLFFIHSYKDKIANNLYDALRDVTNAVFSKSRVKYLSLLDGKGSYPIDQTVFECIEKSDFVICDISKANISPNIWLELGYALAIINQRNFKVGSKLLIVANINDLKKVNIASDISNYNIIKYTNTDNFKKQLIDHLQIIKSDKN